MKRARNIIVALFLTGSIIGGAQAWESYSDEYILTDRSAQEQMKKAPKEALNEASKALDVALEQHDAPAVLAALIKQSTAQTLIDQDSLPSIIKRTEAIADQSTDLVEQSLIRLYTAGLYQEYLWDNYQIAYREEINDFSLPIEAWSRNMFNERIDTLLTQTLAPIQELRAIPIKQYAQALTLGNDTVFRPTLYDFVIAQAIKIYQSIDNYSPLSVEERLKLIPTAVFLNGQPLPENQSKNKILQLYALALKVHAHNELSAPFMMWDLQRIEYLSRDIYYNDNIDNSNFDSYINELKTFLNHYRSLPYSVEIAHLLVSELKETGTYDNAKQALDICDEWIAQYPDYNRIALLKNERKALTDKQLSVQIPSCIYPGESKKIKVSYRNVKEYTLNIYRQPDSLSLYKQNEYHPQKGKWSRENRVVSMTITPSDGEMSLTSRKSDVEIPPLSPGFYVAEMLMDGKSSDNEVNFSVSRVKIFTREAATGKVELLAVDSRSGKPFSQATVKLYSSTSYRSEKELRHTTKTDKIGICSLTLDNKHNSCVKVTIPGDTYAPAVDLSSPYVWKYSDEQKTQTSLFTDRSIYRPGQTVYFSGIRYINNLNTNRVVPNEKVTIALLDASRNSIASLEKTTDEYGQFNGEFNIPRGLMLGNYRIVVKNEGGNSTSFSVEEYKLPIFQVQFNLVKEGGSFGNPLTVTGSATSYSGVPQAGATVEYTIERQSNPYRWSYIPPQQIVADTTTVDASGNFAITFIPQRDASASLRNKEQAYNYLIHATITASTGESVEQSTSITIGDSPYFVSVTAPQLINKYQSAGKIKSEVRTLNGEPVKRERRLVFYSLYDNAQTEELDSLKIKMQVGEVTIPASGTAIYPDFTTWASGPYRIVAFSSDENGRMLQGECNFILYGDKDKSPARHSTLWLPQKEWNVEMDETVNIPVGSSCKEAYLFYSVYSAEKLLETKMLKLNNSCKLIPIQFDKRFKGVATINFLIVKEGKMTTATATIRPQVPSRDLTITTSSFRDKLLPGTTEQWTFSVTDPDGKPIVSRFMAEMFDASMQAIRHHDWNFKAPQPRLNCRISTYPTGASTYLRSISLSDRQKQCNYPQARETNFIYSTIDMNNTFYPQTFVVGYQRLYADGALAKKTGSIEVSADNMAETEESVSPTEQGSPSNTETYRSGEVGTAFFYPTLITDSLGKTTFSFIVPNENTTWQFLALAYTQELFSGKYEAQTVSSKPIMVSPNLPRFVRQGDEVSIATAVQNRTEMVQEGKVFFEIFDPYTEEILHSASVPFLLEAGESQTLNYRFSAPAGKSVIGFRVKATTPQHSDGEQQILPVLPSKVFVTDSQPFFIPSHVDTTTVTLPGMAEKLKSNSVESYRMTLQYCNNPAWYAVQALPALTEPTGQDAISLLANLFANSVAVQLATDNPRIAQAIESWEASGNKNLSSPLAQNEELKQILLSATPWVLDATNETEQMQQLASLFDKNRANLLAQDALRKLQKLMANDGGLRWFSDMLPSFFISLNALECFSHMETIGIPLNEDIKMLQNQLVKFVDQEMVNRWHNTQRNTASYTISYSDLTYLYVRSAYRDIPLTGKALDMHKQMMEQLKSWSHFNDYGKAYAALALHRYGFTTEAKEIVSSLRQYATTTPDKGMFWANSRSSYYHRNGAVQKECAIFRAFAEVDPITAELDAMRQWLLTQKQTNQWASVPSTLDAISVLLTQGTHWLAADTTPSTITWGGKPLEVNPNDAFTGVSEYTLNGSDITPANAQAVITTRHPQPSWGAIYWQYYDDVKNVEAASVKELTLHRQLFVRSQSNESTSYVPLNTTSIKPGDRIAVRLTITAGQDMQFVCLTDNRATCFEPAEQLSGYKYRERIGYYEEIGNTETRFYFEFLPKGTYVITYELNVDRSGEYTQGLSTIQCLYAPQMIARAPAQTVVVK